MTAPGVGEAPASGTVLDRIDEKVLSRVVYGLSGAVCLLVVVLIASPAALRIESVDLSFLPAFHATLNGTCAALLVAGYAFIRRGKIRWHRLSMVGAFSLSCIFLISYVVYHAQSTGASFGGEGWVRPLYFSVLISHIVLAPIVLPLALFAVVRALRGEIGRHKRVARWTFPVWLYVAVTGVAVYLFMAPYY
jgi:putative membrane protein